MISIVIQSMIIGPDMPKVNNNQILALEDKRNVLSISPPPQQSVDGIYLAAFFFFFFFFLASASSSGSASGASSTGAGSSTLGSSLTETNRPMTSLVLIM